jgi:hypothetical protein
MPASEKQPGTDRIAPDPAASYGREKPGKEAGQGRLDNNVATPTSRPDQQEESVPHRQPPRQINAHDEPSARANAASTPLDANPDQPDHSLLDEEPRGEDLTPQDITDPQRKRHPRTEGKGGTP